MTRRHLHRTRPQRTVNACLLWGVVFVLISCGAKEQGASRLANSESPYLREHADNPVNWYPWGEEAFERAEKENKPIIVSIGYAACHWCHVMERESFMDPEVARIMNENFISIKVDREERPDVDQQFVYASQALTGTAGWPLNAFALADGKPFHTITYYPKGEWIDLLNRVAVTWKADSGQIKRQASELTKNIKPLFEYQTPDSVLRLDLTAFLNHVQSWHSSLDFKNGGLSGFPKFPMPSMLEFMLQHSHMTGDKKSLQWVLRTLDAMAIGGIHDQIGGGFSRYSTDSLWRVPHFEKMLYDNAQLASIYSKAYKVTKDTLYKRVVTDLVEFTQNEMLIGDSAFVSSIDADSEGEEGKYYEWTADEFKLVLGGEADEAMAYFGVQRQGESIPRLAGSALYKDVERWKKNLLEARRQRHHPASDKKIITSWNAMMIIALLDAHNITSDDKVYLALNTAHFLDKHMIKNDRVFRTVLFENVPSVEGFLEDYAWLAKAYIRLYQFSLDIEWLQKARRVADLAIEKFKNDNSPFFYYSIDDPNSRLIRSTDLYDQVIPSSNSVFADVLMMLGEYYQEPRYTALAENAIKEMVSSIDLDGPSISNWARIAQILEFSPYEIAITGELTQVQTNILHLESTYLPATIVMGGDQENLPLLENKLTDGGTIIYVCRNRVCKQPVKDLQSALRQIEYN